jgi:hypothetical protein
VENENKILRNVYILNEFEGEKCCIGQVDESWLWHRRMDHINFENLVKLRKTQVVRDMPRISKPMDSICNPCHHGKKTRVSFKTKESSISKPLKLVHIELYRKEIT